MRVIWKRMFRKSKRCRPLEGYAAKTDRSRIAFRHPAPPVAILPRGPARAASMPAVRHARVRDELALPVDAVTHAATLPHGVSLLAALRSEVAGIDAGQGR